MPYNGYEPDQMVGPQRRGLPMRMIMALLIAAFGLFVYYSHTEVNPVTGKKQRIALSVDQEMTLGLEAAPKMASEMGGALDPRKDAAAAFVERIGSKIVAESDAALSPYKNNFHFRLLDDPKTINAFALPGGQVFITKGLFDKLGDEAELAGVLGHEIGHVVGRHAAAQMAKGRLGQMLAVAVGIGASGDQNQRGDQGAMAAAAMANQMMQLHFGRDDESEADRFGIRFMVEAGYNPTALLDVMNILKAASGGSRTPEFLSTHPLPETRLRAIEELIKAEFPGKIPSSLTRGRKLNGDPGR